MATFHVTPGDLITADLFNEFLTRLADLESRVGTGTSGTVTVPLVFGRTLTAALTTLTNPVNQVTPGAIFDTNGAAVNQAQPGAGNLMVIVQMPSAGTRVVAGSAVDLIVAAASSGGGGPSTQPPSIGNVTPDPVPVGATATVAGQRFATPLGANTVTFDGVPGEILAGSTVSLSVKVPTGIPGAPSVPGGATKTDVKVVVRTSAGLVSNEHLLDVSAPEANKPSADTITPSTGVVNSSINIVGTGFSPTLSQNQVTFDGVAGTVTGATATTMSVTVPPGIPGLNSTGDTREDVPVIVTVNGVSSNPKIHAFARL